jgi:hypothetical protein
MQSVDAFSICFTPYRATIFAKKQAQKRMQTKKKEVLKTSYQKHKKFGHIGLIQKTYA